jgi:hypothetical protein
MVSKQQQSVAGLGRTVESELLREPLVENLP